MRLIDADALILALKTQDYSGSPESLEDWTPQDMTKAEIADINNAPTIDAEPVRHGHWIKGKNYNGIYEWQCSVCKRGWTHRTSGDIYVERYCYNCGAKMEDET